MITKFYPPPPKKKRAVYVIMWENTVQPPWEELPQGGESRKNPPKGTQYLTLINSLSNHLH